jgi:hypothetical protein
MYPPANRVEPDTSMKKPSLTCSKNSKLVAEKLPVTKKPVMSLTPKLTPRDLPESLPFRVCSK